MTTKRWSVLVLCIAALCGVYFRAGAEEKVANIPTIVGEWTGEWGPFNPAKDTGVTKERCKGLDCKVVFENGVWQATFEGECGRPYKYTIKMEGRQSGDSVLFKGSADLGEKDGGVYDWVGRATKDEFVGFYTSSHITGVFHLAPKTITSSIPAGKKAE